MPPVLLGLRLMLALRLSRHCCSRALCLSGWCAVCPLLLGMVSDAACIRSCTLCEKQSGGCMRAEWYGAVQSCRLALGLMIGAGL